MNRNLTIGFIFCWLTFSSLVSFAGTVNKNSYVENTVDAEHSLSSSALLDKVSASAQVIETSMTFDYLDEIRQTNPEISKSFMGNLVNTTSFSSPLYPSTPSQYQPAGYSETDRATWDTPAFSGGFLNVASW